MIRRENKKSPYNLDNISELSQLQDQLGSPTKRNRIQPTSVAVSFFKISNSEQIQLGVQHKQNIQLLQEKNRVVKKLQDQIMDKKLRNDRLQEAFRLREQEMASNTNQKDVLERIKLLLSKCVKISLLEASLKKFLFKNIVKICKISAKSHKKGLKSLFIWLITWLNQLFFILVNVLIKN